MIVLLKNIPKNSYHNDIIDIIEPVIKGKLFRANGEINNIDIIALRESDTEELEFQALAHIEPEAAANRVIKKLHGLFIQGNRITVREYFLRSWRNDKRSEDVEARWPLQEKRTNGCRRRQLKVYKVAVPEYQ
jgi:hypothetical protein